MIIRAVIRFWSRKFWEERAAALPPEGWTVGRTDMRSYLADGGYVHYAYSPNARTRVLFRGGPTTALRRAVRFAERMNARGGR